MEFLLISSVIFLGVFTQSLSGFGVALVAMAFLPPLLGAKTAAALVALVALILQIALLSRYRWAIDLRAVIPLAAASLLGIPLGVWALSRVREDFFLLVLGVVIAGYGLYGLLGVRLPALKNAAWAYIAGFVAGLLGGAYNISGPPVVIYGDCQGWEPAKFKSNLQGFFMTTDLFVIANHAWRGNIDFQVGKYFLWALPAIGLGILAGTSLDRRINPQTFRKLVLSLLVILGLRLAVFSL